ncbi:hypothetical protein BGZ76_010333 [Entomortierella beljakovae]|nr:hypothetical protein BGZ76_010333 [Entomortierella beljakovae]
MRVECKYQIFLRNSVVDSCSNDNLSPLLPEHVPQGSRPLVSTQLQPSASVVSRGSSSSVTGLSSASSSTSGSALSSGAVEYVRSEFSANFNAYKGTPWLLSGNTNVDNILFHYTMTLNAESALHSFVLYETQSLIDLFGEDDKRLFQDELQQDNSHQAEQSLSEWKQIEIMCYSVGPDQLHEISQYGWKFDSEIYRTASSTHQNTNRNLEIRQACGSKVEGIFTCKKSNFGIGAIVVGEIDEVSTGTKALDDTRELAKLLKDMFEVICANCKANIRSELRVYGVIVSGLRVERMEAMSEFIYNHVSPDDDDIIQFMSGQDQTTLPPTAYAKTLSSPKHLAKRRRVDDS